MKLSGQKYAKTLMTMALFGLIAVGWALFPLRSAEAIETEYDLDRGLASIELTAEEENFFEAPDIWLISQEQEKEQHSYLDYLE